VSAANPSFQALALASAASRRYRHRSMTHAKALAFTTERFDYTSDLPATANAGNRFYGKDVAEFLTAQLTAHGMPAVFLDEDWGWLVTGQRGSEPVFQIAIHNLSEHREGGRPGANRWGLFVEEFEMRKRLGLFTTQSEVPLSPRLAEAVRAAIVAAGATPESWDEGAGEAG
jgi:hypothetical protein